MKQKEFISFGPAPRIALWIGIILVLVGLVSRYLIGMQGINSLTPSLFGLPIALMGFVALDPQYARGAMLGITIFALLGLLASLYVLPQVNALLMGQRPSESITAIITGSAMLLLCGILLSVCLVAFVIAWYRRRRR
jgi:magnesium-transporting ATPase (P-type)